MIDLNKIKTAAQAATTNGADLPPLPQPMKLHYERPHGLFEKEYYTADQMRDYARAAFEDGKHAGYGSANFAVSALRRIRDSDVSPKSFAGATLKRLGRENK